MTRQCPAINSKGSESWPASGINAVALHIICRVNTRGLKNDAKKSLKSGKKEEKIIKAGKAEKTPPKKRKKRKSQIQKRKKREKNIKKIKKQGKKQ